MGSDNSKDEQTHQEEKSVLLEAAQTVKQLGLASTEKELKEQRHLIARILLYGHRHLINHLHRIERERKKTFMRILRTLDYETIDLLYQNIINEQKAKTKNTYSRFLYLQMSHFSQENHFDCEKLQLTGKKIMLKRKLAIILFVAGQSSRFVDENGFVQDKAFYKENENQDCLLEIILKKIQKKFIDYGQQQLIIVHSEQNSHKLAKVLSNFKVLKPKKVVQNIQHIVDENGKFCLKGNKSCEILYAPYGCGDFYRIIYDNTTLLQYLKEQEIQYVCCCGIQNIYEKVIDFFLLGLIFTKKYDLVFKCTYPQRKDQNLNRIVYDNKKQKLVVEEYEALRQKADPSSISYLEKSPIWMNSLIFHLPKLINYLKIAPDLLAKNRENMNITAKTKKIHYWNPETQTITKSTVFIFERQLSDLFMNQQLKSVGLMVDREEQFMPVISLNEEHIWRQAYKEYFSHIEKLSTRSHMTFWDESCVSILNEERYTQF